MERGCGAPGPAREVICIIDSSPKRAGGGAARKVGLGPLVMRMAFLCLAVVVMAGAGCVTKKQEKLEAQRAYVAGQQQAMQAATAARQQQQGPVVFVQGQVQNPVVPWEEGMKLSEAIVAADYTAFMNPRLIRVIRSGQIVGEFQGVDLLHHKDMELEAGDTVLVIP
jgi:hypothetical protein